MRLPEKCAELDAASQKKLYENIRKLLEEKPNLRSAIEEIFGGPEVLVLGKIITASSYCGAVLKQNGDPEKQEDWIKFAKSKEEAAEILSGLGFDISHGVRPDDFRKEMQKIMAHKC